MNGRIPTRIITAAAALSVLAVGPMTSVASARVKITVQDVEQLCVHENADGSTVYTKEGTRVTVVQKGSTKPIELECRGGEWQRVTAQEATLPHVNDALTGTLPIAAG